MNAPKCTATNYIDFLVASPRAVSGTDAARVQPARARPPTHDAFTRLLHRLEPDAATVWVEAAPLVDRGAASWCWTTTSWISPTPARSVW